jgi:glycosyltransferase involved in cell wall biosynthesis
VGHLPAEVRSQLEPRDDSFGLDHELLLWEGGTRAWHDWSAWRQLRQFYLRTTSASAPPDVVLVRNLSPVFNQFVRWLRRQDPRPAIVLVLADSSTLGLRVPFSRRLRYRFKPMQWMDDVAIKWYDGCIGFGLQTRRFFEPHGVPWMWMPSAPNFPYAPPSAQPTRSGPIRFGYFGSLAEHAAVLPTVQAFLDSGVQGSLHMCGFGKSSDRLAALAARHPNFCFDGLLQRQSDCLDWAQKVDVLINPRLPIWGLENSFPSKIFEYGVTGRAILTTRTGGVDQILGDEGVYLETDDFGKSLSQKLTDLSKMDRAQLDVRGAAIRDRMQSQFNWDVQADRMTRFLDALVGRVPTPNSLQVMSGAPC